MSSRHKYGGDDDDDDDDDEGIFFVCGFAREKTQKKIER